MGEAEATLEQSILTYRDLKKDERARFEAVVKAAVVAAAPWDVDIHVATAEVVVDLAAAAADRVKVTATKFESRLPAAISGALDMLRQA